MQIQGSVLILTANSSTPAYKRWDGGKGTLFAEATWGGGSVKLVSVSPNNTDCDVKNESGQAVSLSANGCINFDLPAGQIKIVITTATAVYAYAVGRHQ